MDGRPFDRLQDVLASAGHRDKRMSIYAQKAGCAQCSYVE
jgi:hypothetical protein